MTAVHGSYAELSTFGGTGKPAFVSAPCGIALKGR